jgi:hypothetical protein
MEINKPELCKEWRCDERVAASKTRNLRRQVHNPWPLNAFCNFLTIKLCESQTNNTKLTFLYSAENGGVGGGGWGGFDFCK